MAIERYSIIANLVDTIKSIKRGDTVQRFDGTDYTYKHTPREVSDDFEIWTNCASFPTIFVNSMNQGFKGEPSHRVRCSWGLVITIYVKSNEGVEQTLSEVLEDVLIAINQDITRGSFANHTNPTGIETETRAVKPYALAELFVDVVYHTGY